MLTEPTPFLACLLPSASTRQPGNISPEAKKGFPKEALGFRV